MAWLLGLADKAENILNKIDQNTAAVLHKPLSTEMNIINFRDTIQTKNICIEEEYSSSNQIAEEMINNGELLTIINRIVYFVR